MLTKNRDRWCSLCAPEWGEQETQTAENLRYRIGAKAWVVKTKAQREKTSQEMSNWVNEKYSATSALPSCCDQQGHGGGPDV